MAHINPRFRTPDVSTWPVAAIAIVWYLVVDAMSENALFDSLTASSLLIAFYYGLTGIACAIYYRRELTKSAKNFMLIGVGPVVGAMLLFWLLVESIIDMSDPENSYTGAAWLGVGPPLVIGIGVFLFGVVFMIFWRFKDGRYWQESQVWPIRYWRPAAATGGRESSMSIVLGYDESPGAERALGYAVDLARLLNDTLVLVYGAEPPGGWATSSPNTPRPLPSKAGPR